MTNATATDASDSDSAECEIYILLIRPTKVGYEVVGGQGGLSLGFT